ncbi:MAG TPA: beta-ketoacyl-ACP synthase II [Isosphaeraceae bacterium]|jgi:3-oxoacyl-[acyl-carrier-protein] synthase II
MARRVVITGLGVVTGLGTTLDRYWSGLCEGRSGVGPLTLFDTTHFKVHFGGQVRDFQPEVLFGVKESRRLDRFAQFALSASQAAVQDAGIEFETLRADRCGVYIGSGIGGLSEFESQHATMLERGPAKISPFTIPKLMVNAGSGQVSIYFGLKGPTSAVATACASATNAIGDAFKLIQTGLADVMITGGSEAAITPMGLGGFAAMRALSTRNDDPQRASRPFDRDRDGFVLSEGAGIVVLEDEQTARARGARIYAEVLGYGMSADGSHITAPDEEGRGAAKAMSNCLADGRRSPEDVDYINAHGTSTGLGDLAETMAMKSVFGPHAARLQISSTKSQLGHLLGASGGVELVASALALHTGVLPPTINLDTPDEGCDLDYIPHTAREVRVDHVMSNSFGFGGHNASLLIGRYGLPDRR